MKLKCLLFGHLWGTWINGGLVTYTYPTEMKIKQRWCLRCRKHQVVEDKDE